MGAPLRGAPRRRSAHDQPDPALVEGRHPGRRRGLSKRGGNPTRRFDQRPAEQRVPALCTRPMVRARGQTPAAGRGPHDQIHRRLCDVFPISRGCRTRPGRLVQTAGKVRPDPGTDQDQARRIWPVRATTCRQTRQEAPRDDLLSGVHALLHAEPEGQLQDWDAHREISLAAQSHVVAGPAATNPALVGPGTGQRSQRRTEGPLRLLRHCRKLSFPAKGPSGGRTLLAQNAMQPELDWAPHVGHVPPDQTAATDPATKAVPSLWEATSSRSAVNHLLKSVVREICTLRSGAARLAAILAGASPANKRSPVHVVVISSGSEGDQTAGSLEVKALWGRETWSDPSKGGEQPGRLSVSESASPEIRAPREADCANFGSAEPLRSRRRPFGIGELDHDDDRTPRGHRERHVRKEWSAKARNHSRVASALPHSEGIAYKPT